MKVTIVCIAFIVWCCPLLAGQITDDYGRVVNFSQSPQRIVSLLPSLTEMVCKLGQCRRLVGVDRYSTWPASISGLPRMGGGLDPNIEAIVAMRPDAVLVGTSSPATADRLLALGITVIALEPKTHADIRRVFDKIGVVLGFPDAKKAWQEIDAGIAAATRSLPAHIGDVRVYFEANQGPYGAGENSFIGETLTHLGVKNIVPASMGPFPKLNPEFIVRANPDVIMIGARSADSLVQRPGWQNIRAIREKRVCIFSPEETDILVRPGPRMADAAWLMARCLSEKL